MTTKDISPLLALADAIASKKQINNVLLRAAELSCKKAFVAKDESPTPYGGPHNAVMRATMRKGLEAALGKRYFADFGRKKAIDRAVKKALAKTSAVRLAIIREVECRCKERERNYDHCSDWDKTQIHKTVVEELWP